MQFSPLLDLVTNLLDGTKLSLNVVVTSYIFDHKKMYLPPRYLLHAIPVCGAAKTTKAGLGDCLLCKKVVTQKVQKEKKPFFGPCAYGLMEYVYPVIINNDIKCILFIGNMLMDKQMAEERIRRRCRRTGVSAEKVIRALDSCETHADLEKVKKIAELIGSYIRLLASNLEYKPHDMHWAVYRAKQAIDTGYSDQLTLKKFADSLYINEKYLGRIFAEQMGMSFHEYLNRVRLHRASQLLRDTDLSVTVIAYECGFSNIPYFNRSFKKMFRVTPGHVQKYGFDENDVKKNQK